MRKNWKILLAIPIILILTAVGFYYYLVQTDKTKNLENQISGLKNSLLASEKKVSQLSGQKADNVVIYGDSRTGVETHKKILALIEKRQPEAVFNVGDIVEEGKKPDEWPVFNQLTKELRSNTNYYPVLGNHEQDSPLFYGNFELPGNEQWYSLNFNKIHFVVLNSNKDLKTGSEQYKWLENDLANVGKDLKFTVLVFHHPLYSTGKHGQDPLDFKPDLLGLIGKYKVDAVFNGHDHDYEKSEAGGVEYFVVGGGGAPLYPQVGKSEASKKFLSVYHYSVLERNDNELKIDIYDINDQKIDEVSINSKK